MDPQQQAPSQGSQFVNYSQNQAENTPPEIYYDKASSYSGFCSKDADMTILAADIRSQGSTVTCRDSSKSYFVSASLIDTTTTIPSYFRVDSTGVVDTVTRVPSTGYRCK